MIQIIELPDHPYYIGVQFHPEFKSRPGKPSALFLGTTLISILFLFERVHACLFLHHNFVLSMFRQCVVWNFVTSSVETYAGLIAAACGRLNAVLQSGLERQEKVKCEIVNCPSNKKAYQNGYATKPTNIITDAVYSYCNGVHS